MKILLLGKEGQVGRAISQYAQTQQLPLLALNRLEADITNEANLVNVFERYRPDVVINAAAFTAVDLAESQPQNAHAINQDAVESLAKLCQRFSASLVHYSTDYVFDGSQKTAYQESDLANPQSVYGHTKWQGEQAIQAHLQRYFILRVSWVFSEYGKNFVKTILNLAQHKTELNIVSDQIGCPTAAAHIADVTWQCITQLQETNYGLYHYADEPSVSWYDFACAIVHEAKKYSSLQVQSINPITSKEFPTVATRPLNSVLDCRKIETIFGLKRFHWQDELERIIKNDLYL